MKSQKGVTMMMLIIYIASFLVISGIIAGITVFFYNNTSLINKETYSATEYDKINMYIVKESEESNNRIERIALYDEENAGIPNENKMVKYILFTNRR